MQSSSWVTSLEAVFSHMLLYSTGATNTLCDKLLVTINTDGWCCSPLCLGPLVARKPSACCYSPTALIQLLSYFYSKCIKDQSTSASSTSCQDGKYNHANASCSIFTILKWVITAEYYWLLESEYVAQNSLWGIVIHSFCYSDVSSLVSFQSLAGCNLKTQNGTETKTSATKSENSKKDSK